MEKEINDGGGRRRQEEGIKKLNCMQIFSFRFISVFLCDGLAAAAKQASSSANIWASLAG